MMKKLLLAANCLAILLVGFSGCNVSNSNSSPSRVYALDKMSYGLNIPIMLIDVLGADEFSTKQVNIYKISVELRQDGKDFTSIAFYGLNLYTGESIRYDRAVILVPFAEDVQAWERRLASVRKEYEEHNRPRRIVPSK